MFESRVNPLVNQRRSNESIDIVQRIGVITPQRVHLRNYPIDNPTTVFNSAILIRDDTVELYARIILGYFTYSSSIALIEIPIEDVLERRPLGHYPADIIIHPANRYDLWGTEDPRVYVINNTLCMTYCGRTVAYFNPTVRVERTLPITAVCMRRPREWRKVAVFRLPPSMRSKVVSDKDAFLARGPSGEILLFHRPHVDNQFYNAVSRVPYEAIDPTTHRIREVIVQNTVSVIEPAPFEEKIGWGTPPIRIDNEYLMFLHGVDRELLQYQVFAILMDLRDGPRVTAVTPHYIMRPRMNYEVYGDRPLVIFPCGAVRIDNFIILSYGAADTFLGLGMILVDELLALLDSNRIE